MLLMCASKQPGTNPFDRSSPKSGHYMHGCQDPTLANAGKIVCGGQYVSKQKWHVINGGLLPSLSYFSTTLVLREAGHRSDDPQ